ncbi:MAG: hypothetical protein JWP65_3099 [Ramlibacter sp.]|jgi:hypothetical protein|uniref:hypothetical protein n=1 Tax=Ramlibacter sp. TaxID=1917967 RepID=UPI002618B66C|nr:hypothetical protein [Ramlibacter sp.]MDB5752678.1 hypothetical protein [Ramlibacter sp.]
MIQLATDPKASRTNWGDAGDAGDPGADGKEASAQRRGRIGHAWPFLSRADERPAAQQQRQRAPNNQSGS